MDGVGGRVAVGCGDAGDDEVNEGQAEDGVETVWTFSLPWMMFSSGMSMAKFLFSSDMLWFLRDIWWISRVMEWRLVRLVRVDRSDLRRSYGKVLIRCGMQDCQAQEAVLWSEH